MPNLDKYLYNANQSIPAESGGDLKKTTAPHSDNSQEVESLAIENYIPEKKNCTNQQNSTGITDRAVKKVKPISLPSSSKPMVNTFQEIEAFTGPYMNTSGAIMMSQHFTEKYQDKSKGYSVTAPIWHVVSNPMDINELCSLNKEEHMYCLQVLTGKRHWVPVIINNNKAFIFCSLGGDFYNMAEIMMPLKKLGFEIYSSEDKRQNDNFTCGTDSCSVINKCLQMGKNLTTWVDENVDDLEDDEDDEDDEDNPHNSYDFTSAVDQNLLISDEFKDFYNTEDDMNVTYKSFRSPPEIQKYQQSLRHLKRNKYRNKAMMPLRSNKKGQTLGDYVDDHKRQVDGRLINPTMNDRYNKYKIIASEMLKTKQDNLAEIVLDKTGLGKLLEQYPEKVRNHPQTENLVNQFISDRLGHKVYADGYEAMKEMPFLLSLNWVRGELDKISAE